VSDDKRGPDSIGPFGAPKPSDFLRGRRPERFSDTPKTGRSVLPRDLLEYKLETLTSRKQEADFEEFARKLAERELCPNLLPQTGPTGGGDSKTDASTYPVAPVLAERWYRGTPNPPSKEYWAFAFSTKERWKEKLSDDIKKIAELEPKPEVAYFVTSRFVRDKERGELESALTTAHGLRVKILDRNWIVDKTIDNRHEDLAIRYLRIDAPTTAPPQLGPRDAARNAELAKLLEELRNPALEEESDYALAEKYLRAARMSREMEAPRAQTEGLLTRARDLAAKSGVRAQELRAVYDYAWTLYWWYDDAKGLAKLYPRAEALALASDDAEDADLVLNLLSLLTASYRNASLTVEDVNLPERHSALKKHLDRLVTISGRPNNALHARAERDILVLLVQPTDPKVVAAVFQDLKECLSVADSFGTYPARQYIDLVAELGAAFGQHDGYDALFEEARRVAAKREGELNEGELLYKRGFQLLEAGRDRDALATLEQARLLLSKRETLRAAARALLGSGIAYARLGLSWAARTNVASAFQRLAHEKDDSGAVRDMARSALRLLWLEIQLGRVPQAVAWSAISRGLIRRVQERGSDVRRLDEEFASASAALGASFLRADVSELKVLTKLPDGLERTGLFIAKNALLYALGQASRITDDLKAFGDREQEQEANFHRWAELPGEDIAARLATHAGLRETYSTVLFGSDVIVELDNNPACIEIAEMLLGGLEAFFATASTKEMLFHTPRLMISVRSGSLAPFPPKREFRLSAQGQRWDIVVPEDVPEKTSQEQIKVLREWLLESIGDITAHAAFAKDLKSVTTKLGADMAVSRALEGTLTGSVLPREDLSLARWEGTEVELLRSGPFIQRSTPVLAKPNPVVPGTGPVPAELLREIRHRDAKLLSVINVPRWNRAKWRGIGVHGSYSDAAVPAMLLVYEDANEGRTIFSEWRETIGEADTDDKIRIAIIQNLDESLTYGVHIGSNMQAGLQEAKEGRFIASVGRVQIIEHPDPHQDNVGMLRRSFERRGEFILAPAHATANGVMVDWSVAIRKRHLVFRRAAEIGEHDEDRLVLLSYRGRRAPGKTKDAGGKGKKKRKKAARRDRDKHRRQNKRRK
jgi:hypothetical protein